MFWKLWTHLVSPGICFTTVGIRLGMLWESVDTRGLPRDLFDHRRKSAGNVRNLLRYSNNLKAICGANLRRGLFGYYVDTLESDVFGEPAMPGS